MVEIYIMAQGHEFWSDTIAYAEGCSWKAGPFLAGRMKQNEFHTWERVLAAVEDGNIVGYCTLSEKDELPDKYGLSPFIGFVFVDEAYRRKRISELMIRTALIYADEIGYDKIYIMSGEQGLYEKYGFEKLGDYETIYGSTDQLFVRSTRL